MAINNFSQVAREVLLGANQVENRAGRFYIDGNQTRVTISQAIAEALYVGEIFRNGMGCTTKYTANAKPLDTIRVRLSTPLPSSSRTIPVGSKPGQARSAFNPNAPILPSDDEFLIAMNQVNDQQLIFPDLILESMDVNYVADKIGAYAQSVGEDRSGCILAEILAYNIYRAMNNSGKNLKVIANLSVQDAIADALHDIGAKLSDGDEITGAHAYPIQGRTIFARPEFIGRCFTSKSGIILTGGDLAQSMIKEMKFDGNIDEKNYVGNAYRGRAAEFDFQECNSRIWHLAEDYLGLARGALDHVYAVACSSEANAVGANFDFGVKITDADTVRGLKAQPINCWGQEAFRLSYIIGDSSLTTDALSALGFSADKRRYPVHPDKIEGDSDKVYYPIYDADNNIIGYKDRAIIPKPHGGEVAPVECKVTLTTKISTSATDLSATPVVKVGNIEYVVTKKADTTGIYEFVLPYSQGAVVTCTHVVSGTPDTTYTGTATITNAQASAGTYELTITLTEVV